MAKADRIAGYFPSLYRGGARKKLLNEVVGVLAAPIEEADSVLFRIQRAHRLNVAEDPIDIARLAAALHLAPVHFEDITADKSLPFAEGLDRMRERVRRIARVHLRGLGTPWAVIESTAIFLNGAIVPERPGDPLIKHLDASSHVALVEFTHVKGRPRDRIYLHENPLVRRKVEPAARYPMDRWAVDNHNFEDSPVILSIQGVGDRTVVPTIFCPEAGAGIVFNGVVPDGKRLLIDSEHGARLDGVPVDEWLTVFHGGLYDFTPARQILAAVAEEAIESPFAGDLSAVPAAGEPKTGIPTARRGPSTWYFRPAVGLYDAAVLEYSVFDTPPEPIGVYDGDFKLDACVFDYPPSGVAGMSWEESLACSFKLLVPAANSQPSAAQTTTGSSQPPDVVGRVARFLPRFKGAGIRAYVDATPDAWILGESVLRGADAAGGEGVTNHATRIRDPRSDRFVDAEVAA
jgi:hypothetical protein